MVNELVHTKNKIPSFITLRKQVKSRISASIARKIEKSGIPVHTFDNSINDVIKAYKTTFTLKRNGNIKHFRIRYKKKSAPKSILVLEASAFSKKHNSFVVKQMGNYIESGRESLCGINRDSRLQYNKRTGEMILYVPQDRNIKEAEEDTRGNWCSLDPGIRTFQTLYSGRTMFSDCVKGEYGTREAVKMNKIIKQINDKKDNEGTKWYSKFKRNRYRRLQNLRDELHWKTALDLVKSYDTILIGSMSTKSIVSKRLNLNKTSKTTAYALSHYLFKQRLEAKAEEYGSRVIVVDEHYTSKTCGGCFRINHNLGSNKTFNCPQVNCDFTLDRDLNGARNIALRHFGLFNPIFDMVN
jgi:IS605 OrfB family transposase